MRVSLIPLLILLLISISIIPRLSVTVSHADSNNYNYRYVFIMLHDTAAWPADGFDRIVVVNGVYNNTNICIDYDLNGKIDDNDICKTINMGQNLIIGESNVIENYIKYDKKVLAIYSNKPVVAQYIWNNNDYGMYDVVGASYQSPYPGTQFVVYGKEFYITSYNPTQNANVYVNGSYQGTVGYGQLLTFGFNKPRIVVITSDNPIIVVHFSVDVENRDKIMLYSPFPPMNGEYWFPPSIAQQAYKLNMSSIHEDCLVLSADGRLLDNISIIDVPRTFSFSFPVSIICRRIVNFTDPWTGSQRTILDYFPVYSSEAVSNNTVGFALAQPYGAHGTFYAAFIGSYGDAKVLVDEKPFGSIDKEISLTSEESIFIKPEDVEKPVKYYIVGKAYVSMTFAGAWDWNADQIRDVPSASLFAGSQSGQNPYLNITNTSPPTSTRITTTQLPRSTTTYSPASTTSTITPSTTSSTTPASKPTENTKAQIEEKEKSYSLEFSINEYLIILLAVLIVGVVLAVLAYKK